MVRRKGHVHELANGHIMQLRNGRVDDLAYSKDAALTGHHYGDERLNTERTEVANSDTAAFEVLER